MRRSSCSLAAVLLAFLSASGLLLGQSPDAPTPTVCSAMDRSFINAYHLYAGAGIALIFGSALLILPRLNLNRWSCARPIRRIAYGAGPLLFLLLGFLALPLIETVYSISVGGVSILTVYQVTDSYLDCQSVDYAKQAFLWGDFFNAASKPAIYLGLYQLITFFLLAVVCAAVTYAVHKFLVKQYTLRGEL